MHNEKEAEARTFSSARMHCQCLERVGRVAGGETCQHKFSFYYFRVSRLTYTRDVIKEKKKTVIQEFCNWKKLWKKEDSNELPRARRPTPGLGFVIKTAT